MEAEDNVYRSRAVEASTVALQVVEECVDGKVGVEGARGAKRLVPRLVNVVQDELMRPHLDRADTALVLCPRCPLMLHDAHAVEGGQVGVELDNVREDIAGEAAHCCDREGHKQAADNKRFIEALEVGVVWFLGNPFKCIARRCEDSGDVREVGHSCFGGRGVWCGCLQSSFFG